MSRTGGKGSAGFVLDKLEPNGRGIKRLQIRSTPIQISVAGNNFRSEADKSHSDELFALTSPVGAVKAESGNR